MIVNEWEWKYGFLLILFYYTILLLFLLLSLSLFLLKFLSITTISYRKRSVLKCDNIIAHFLIDVMATLVAENLPFFSSLGKCSRGLVTGVMVF